MDDFWNQTGIEKQLSGLESRRAALCSKRAQAKGMAQQLIEAELSEVNNKIKAMNLMVNERREARSLWLAARNVLDEQTFEKFTDTARAHRMGIKVLS
jgi:hypothetical protein